MEPRMKESHHIAEKKRICPGCGAEDSIIYSKIDGKQSDLFGNSGKVWSTLKWPTCRKCRKRFPRDWKFEERR